MATILTCDFDSTAYPADGFTYYEKPGNRPNAMQRTSVRSRTSAYSCLVHLESTDENAQNGNRRAELSWNNAQPPTNTTARWYAVSWYFPAATNLSDTREHIIIQWHDRYMFGSNSASPMLALEVKNDRFRLARRYSTADYITTPSSIVGPIFTDLGAIPKDQWLDFVFYYNPQANSSGEIKVWINDVQVFSFTGFTHYVNSYFPYLKLGIYKWLWNGSLVSPNVVEFYLDRARIADGNSIYADVAVSGSGGGSANLIPVTSAGNSQVFPNSTTAFSLTGSATDPDGTVASVAWTRLSGPNTPTFVSPSSLTTSVTGAIPGLYTFKLTATDNMGATASANTTVRVNLLPVVDLSGNLTNYVAGTTSVTINSSVVDSDGTISSYEWAQIQGPAVTIVTPTTANTNITGLEAGSYGFSLTAIDNNGEEGTGEIYITIGQAFGLRSNRRFVEI